MFCYIISKIRKKLIIDFSDFLICRETFLDKDLNRHNLITPNYDFVEHFFTNFFLNFGT